MISFSSKLRTAAALGLPSLARVAAYRAGVRLGLHPVRKLRAAVPAAPFFRAAGAADALPQVSARWRDSACWFSRWPVAVDAAPFDWHSNPLRGSRLDSQDRPWWELADFDPAVGDIKLVWEASRLDWVLAFAQRVRAGEEGALARLNDWLAHWAQNNAPYHGVNWKCGQEASIRVMHLAMAALLLGQQQDSCPGLLALVKVHLRRIAPTIGYAVAQDNNHGTSEAAALFIGGSWLAAHGDPDGPAWQRSGVRWLENRAARLIGEDGSFSQYSMTYHRMLLDTLSMAELWRQRLGLAPLSQRFVRRAAAATRWLHQFTDADSGDAPNLGANDGARLLQLSDADYRDFRPAVQLASALFLQRRAYPADGSWNLALAWLDVALPAQPLAAPVSTVYDDGGFAALRRGAAMALLRYPRFRFRPSQADVLHLDLWLGGRNLLRDAGSYSYNAEPEWNAYFPGTAAHNTVQFDGRDQMPRWSRFLFADWLACSSREPLVTSADAVRFGAGYASSAGPAHRRSVTLSDDALQVTDVVSGFAERAVLRWRLAPGPWRVEGQSVTNGRERLDIAASVPLARLALVEGWESRYYLEKTVVPVVEVEINVPGELTSMYRWSV